MSTNTGFKYNIESVFTRKLPSAVYNCGERMVVDWARCSSANEYTFWTMFSMTKCIQLFRSANFTGFTVTKIVP